MLKVFYFSPENSGVSYYRFYQPLKELETKGMIEVRNWGFDFTGKRLDLPTTKELVDIIAWGDLFIFGRMDVPDYFKMIQTVKEFSKKKVLLDVDDNIFSISPYLPARISYDPNGLAMKIHWDTIKYVDGIIVSTPPLEKLYKDYNKVWIISNGVHDLFSKTPHEGVNIGYMCTNSHLENAQLVEAPILKILQKYSNVKFYFTRAFRGFFDSFPKELEKQVNEVPFFPLKDYLKYVNNLHLDIGIAPLMDNYFNQCKSNIRILEYWQNQTAVVASPVGEYTKTIKDGFDGSFAKNDEWEEKLDELIQNPEKRKYFICNSIESLKQFDISLFADMYYNVIRENTIGNNT